MTGTWFIGDLHLGHANIIKFTGNDGQRIRPFESIEEHDETLIANFNRLVGEKDRVYFFGDLVIGRKHIHKIGRFNGRKKLIKGNHDIFKLEDYTPYFDDIISYRIYPDVGMVCSHIPVHPCQLYRRFKANVHGHLHSNLVKYSLGKDGQSSENDPRYINICPEHTNWRPVHFEDIKKQVEAL